MLSVSPPMSVSLPGRAGPDPAPAPAPPALSAPAMTVGVEWQGAVRPPDATARTGAPELPAARDPDLRRPEGPTGPPPAFLANILDQLPDSLVPDSLVPEGFDDPTEAAPNAAEVAPDEARHESTTAAVGAEPGADAGTLDPTAA
ncbi:MAG: hypothetical protein ACXIU8_05800 [Alkalilacustris sp.]